MVTGLQGNGRVCLIPGRCKGCIFKTAARREKCWLISCLITGAGNP